MTIFGWIWYYRSRPETADRAPPGESTLEAFYFSRKTWGAIHQMKPLVIAAACIILLAGCQPKEQTAAPTTSQAGGTETAKQEGEAQKVQVDKGLLNVEITLPASLFKNQDMDKVIEKAKADGVKDVTPNPDGSVTYKMPKSVHAEMMKKMEKNITDSVQDLKSGNSFKSIKDVTHNKSFSEFTLIVDKSAYEKSFDGFASIGLGMSGMYYQLFNGVSSEKLKVSIQIKDEATKEVFKTIVYPDALDQMKK